MLHTETVEGTTLQLLKKLKKEEFLKRFHLAGGTALALYLGHRKSVDLDLFSPEPFDVDALRRTLENVYGFRTDFTAKNTLKGSINNVKLDCITYACPMLEEPYMENGISLYSQEDIIAMKLSAIADNGTRLKDFIDIAYMSTRFSFYAMLQCYSRKFPEVNIVRPLKAVTYFEDIDFEEDVVMLSGKFNWTKVKKRLIDMSGKQDKIFGTFPM